MISWSRPPALLLNSLDFSSAEINDREIKIWKTCTVPFPKDNNPLDEWRHDSEHLFPWLSVLARRVLAIPASSACDNLEVLVYLHEVWPQLREWKVVKKMRLENFFFESTKRISFNVFSCLLLVDSETPSK